MIILFVWQVYDILSYTKIATLLGVSDYFYSLENSIYDYQLVRVFYSPFISFFRFIKLISVIIADAQPPFISAEPSP